MLERKGRRSAAQGPMSGITDRRSSCIWGFLARNRQTDGAWCGHGPPNRTAAFQNPLRGYALPSFDEPFPKAAIVSAKPKADWPAGDYLRAPHNRTRFG